MAIKNRVTKMLGAAYPIIRARDSIALSGQVAGRIHSVKPVAEIIAETVKEFQATTRKLAGEYETAWRPPS